MRIDLHRQRDEVYPVFAQYGLSPLKIRPVRGVLRVQTKDGDFALKRSSSSPKQLSFVHRALEEILSAGYDHLLPWLKTRSGEPFVVQEQTVWYATPWYGEGATLRDKVEPSEQLAQLARLHRFSQSIAAAETDFHQPVSREYIANWKQQQGKMEKYLESLQRREFHSPFDKVFSKNADYLDKAFSFAIQGMERFVTTEEGRPPRWSFCHGRMDPRNVVYGEKGWKWIDWDHARVTSPVRDVAAYLRRFSDVEPEEPDFAVVLAHYEKEWELTNKEKKLLALYLAYPERPYRLLRNYYEKSIRVSEAEAVQLLEREVIRLQSMQKLIRTLWPQGKRNRAKEVAQRKGREKLLIQANSKHRKK